MKRTSPNAFTLVELLVVVAIILVLLALLMPALDKAIYQAELAVCAANQKGIASTGTTYAVEYKRRYVSGSVPRNGGYQPHMLGSENGPAQDIRPLLEPYMPINMFVDPLAKRVDLNRLATDSDTSAFSTYEVWMGWQYAGELGGKGMMKIGDRVEWVDNLNGNRKVSHDYLVSGLNTVRLSNAGENAHPDSEGRAYAKDLTNKDWLLGGSVGISKVTVSFWEWAGPRGTVDQNYASADGSVTRFNKITGVWNNVEDVTGTRFYAAPWHADSATASTSDKRWLPGR